MLKITSRVILMLTTLLTGIAFAKVNILKLKLALDTI